MPQKSIIIIGAGIAGLSAGCYGQMNGFRTRIFEMHKKKPGGLCTSWKRQGYTVNGCLHWLIGSSPGTGFHNIWQQLGALQDKKILDYGEYARIETLDGKRFIIPTDLGKLEQNMKQIAPEDTERIDEFIAAVRKCIGFEPPVDKAPELMSFFDVMAMVVGNLGVLRMLRRWGRVSLREYGEGFKSPVLRKAFPLLFMPDFPVAFMIMTFAWMHKKCAGYVIGGALEFSRGIEKRYLSLGGEMNYKSRVIKILTENGRATGIRLEDGSEHRADYVISAADGHATIFDMLEGQFIDDTIRGYYENLIPFPPLVHIALGVNRSFPEMPPSAGLALELTSPLIVGGVEHNFLNVQISNFDPGAAPEGKSVLLLLLVTDYEYWRRLRENDEQYKAEKESLAEKVISILDKRFPGLAAQVEMHDVATPTTFVRYTGNWKGSFEGWQITPTTWSLDKVMKKTLPGLDNFYMAGQWVEPGGGLPTVAVSGRNVIQLICKREKRKFTAIKP